MGHATYDSQLQTKDERIHAEVDVTDENPDREQDAIEVELPVENELAKVVHADGSVEDRETADDDDHRLDDLEL